MGYSILVAIAVVTVSLAAHPTLAKESHDEESKIVGTISAKNLTEKDFTKAAKITSAQASKTANDTVTGSILSVGLEKEDGFLIYSVEIVNPTSGLHEILVDAGSGKILANQNKDKDKKLAAKDDEQEEDDDED